MRGLGLALLLGMAASAGAWGEACVVHSSGNRVDVKLCQQNRSLPSEMFKSGFCQPQLKGQKVEVEFVEQCPGGAFGVCRNATAGSPLLAAPTVSGKVLAIFFPIMAFVAMGFDQLINGLQTGVVDGAENNFPSYDTAGHFEVAMPTLEQVFLHAVQAMLALVLQFAAIYLFNASSKTGAAWSDVSSPERRA